MRSIPDIPYYKPVLPCEPGVFGSPLGRDSGCTKVSKSPGAGLLLLLRRQAATQGGETILCALSTTTDLAESPPPLVILSQQWKLKHTEVVCTHAF